MDFGDDALAGAAGDFNARWRVGLSHLVGDSDALSKAVRASAARYLKVDEQGVELLADSFGGAQAP